VAQDQPKADQFSTLFLPEKGSGSEQFRPVINLRPLNRFVWTEFVWMEGLIKEVPDCTNISDNIWLWSKDREAHLKQLNQLLTILENQWHHTETTKVFVCSAVDKHVWHIVSEKGIRPDSTKVEAITNAHILPQHQKSDPSRPHQLLFEIYSQLQ
jgi:hypothetical protein